MKLLVIGRTGQLARSLAERLPADWQATFMGRDRLDLAAPVGIAALVAAEQPSAIVNAAAYTAVDAAETDRDTAFAVNAGAPDALARAAAAADIPFVHVSTDYVFDDAGTAALAEDTSTAPLGVYGASKLAGEQAVVAAGGDPLILRTAWVYSPFGRNFVRTMLGLAETRDEIRVVADQHGSPTSALDLADAIITALSWRAKHDRFPAPLMHAAGSGEASWAVLAAAVMDESRAQGGPSARIVPIATADYPTPARRPVNSRLDSTLFARSFGHALPDWRGGVARTVARLAAPVSEGIEA